MSATKEKTITVFGMTLPVIADLPGGYALAKHKNGPCIVNWHSMWTLDCAADGKGDIEDDCFTLPHDVRRAAIKAYVDWSWEAKQ